MTSYITEDFIDQFKKLPSKIKKKAKKAFELWKDNPYHPSLQFKQIHSNEPIYSARIGLNWRVLGLKDGDNIYWFWIGNHADYDRLIDSLISYIQF